MSLYSIFVVLLLALVYSFDFSCHAYVYKVSKRPISKYYGDKPLVRAVEMRKSLSLASSNSFLPFMNQQKQFHNKIYLAVKHFHFKNFIAFGAKLIGILSLSIFTFGSKAIAGVPGSSIPTKGWDLYGRVPHDDFLFSTSALISSKLLKRSIVEAVRFSYSFQYLSHL